jgi:plasmid stabilization system protein ParE
MVQVIWTEPALHDLDAIADYIALDKPDAASRLVQRVFERVDLLTIHPEIGPRVPELLPDTRYRHVVERPCRIFYRYDRRAQRVFILAVMRGERLLQHAFLTGRDEPGA